jgi:hypothetical protein
VFVFVGFFLIRLVGVQGPAVAANVAAYRADPACSAPMATAAPGSVCSFADAKIVAKDPGASGTAKTGGSSPHVTLALAGGSTVLVTPADDRFIGALTVGEPARVELFKGIVVKVSTASAVTDTNTNPLEIEHTNPILYPIGAVFALAGLVMAFQSIRRSRRRA